MSKIKFWMLSIFAISVLLTSCGETIDESQVLVEFLESADSPIDAASIAKYIAANDLQPMVATGAAYVIDIRGEADYNAGHIKDAVRVDEKSVIAHLNSMDVSGYEKIVIACKTGQTAAFVTSLARLAGYNAFSLKWGMCSWNEATAGPLNSNSTNAHAGDLVTTATEKAAVGTLPLIETGYETAQEILDAQIATVAEDGFGNSTITAQAVFEAPENYYIVNYWKLDHYNLGHISTAVQYTPDADLLSTTALKTLPTDKTIVVYCYTGQTSSFMTAYLKVLGYDCKSLLFGANGFATDWAATNGLTHWDVSYIAGLPLE